jgi:hypothetical protein
MTLSACCGWNSSSPASLLSWSTGPVVEVYRAMRGASLIVAVTFAAELGDVRRFETPRQLMSFLGLVPAESSTGETVRRKGLLWTAIAAPAGCWWRRPQPTAILAGSAKRCGSGSTGCPKPSVTPCAASGLLPSAAAPRPRHQTVAATLTADIRD